MPFMERPPDEGPIKDQLLWVLAVSNPSTKNFKTALGYLNMILNNGKMTPGYGEASEALYNRVRLSAPKSVPMVADSEETCKVIAFRSTERESS